MPGKLKVQGVEEEGSAAMEEGEGFNLNELIGTDSLSKGVFGFRGKRQSPSAGTYTTHPFCQFLREMHNCFSVVIYTFVTSHYNEIWINDN